MNITLEISNETQTELAKRAAAAGTDVAGYVIEIVRQQLASDGNGCTPADVPYEEWSREFHGWIASHQSRNPRFDDSRGSMYD